MSSSGYYTHISTLADVQENVMEYLHVLSRPMVINHDHDIIWTEAYMDTVVSHSRSPAHLSRLAQSYILFITLDNITHLHLNHLVIFDVFCVCPCASSHSTHDPLGIVIHHSKSI